MSGLQATPMRALALACVEKKICNASSNPPAEPFVAKWLFSDFCCAKTRPCLFGLHLSLKGCYAFDLIQVCHGSLSFRSRCRWCQTMRARSRQQGSRCQRFLGRLMVVEPTQTELGVNRKNGAAHPLLGQWHTDMGLHVLWLRRPSLGYGCFEQSL